MSGFSGEGEVDGDDVAGFEKGVKVGVGDVIMVMGAVIAYDSGAEGFDQLGGAVSDGAGADDAYYAVLRPKVLTMQECPEYPRLFFHDGRHRLLLPVSGREKESCR